MPDKISARERAAIKAYLDGGGEIKICEPRKFSDQPETHTVRAQINRGYKASADVKARRMRILDHVMAGLTNKEIAKKAGYSVGLVSSDVAWLRQERLLTVDRRSLRDTPNKLPTARERVEERRQEVWAARRDRPKLAEIAKREGVTSHTIKHDLKIMKTRKRKRQK